MFSFGNEDPSRHCSFLQLCSFHDQQKFLKWFGLTRPLPGFAPSDFFRFQILETAQRTIIYLKRGHHPYNTYFDDVLNPTDLNILFEKVQINLGYYSFFYVVLSL